MHRRIVVRAVAIAACLAAAVAAPAEAAPPPPAPRRPPPAAAAANAGQPPHAWLFGTWTGGIFPVPDHLSAEACLSQPVVIFTRDLVLRATLTDQFYTQRLIVTALTTATGTQFQFTPVAASTGLLAGMSPGGAGFGCGDPDVLTVERKTDTIITFPNCADFPNPLVRCPSR
jgi:hypothetical protein